MTAPTPEPADETTAVAGLDTLLARVEFRATLELAAALEKPIMDGAPSRDLFGILAAALSPAMWQDLPEADEAKRAQAEALLRARIAGRPRPPESPMSLGGYL